MKEKTSSKQLQFLFQNVYIAGLGLIGGSLAKVCRKNNIAKNIFGFDLFKSEIDLAISQKIIDEEYLFNQKISNNDLVIIAAPLSCYEEIFAKLKPVIEDCLLIDVGSVKSFAIELAAQILQEKAKNFVACHPIAGSEKSGIINANQDLFLNKKSIICSNKINQEVVKKAELFWQKIGCSIEFIDAKEHDKIFALVSHLPQFLAFLAKENIEDEVLKKHLRLQNSNPKIWQEIFALNHLNIKNYLDFYLQNIEMIIGCLNANKFKKVEDFLDSSLLENNNPKLLLAQKAGIQEVLIQRKILISCFLDIPDIKKFKQYAGSGFKDFTNISYLTSSEILESEQKSLIRFLESIKLKISNYVFI